MTRGMLLAGAAALDSGVLMEGLMPPKPIRVLPITVKEGPRAHRRRTGVNGRLEFVQDIQLQPGYGTHYSYLYIGTPPQRVSVIIDTGSRYTAFPCTGCSKCGSKHTDQYWDEKNSTSKVIPSCFVQHQDCQTGFTCAKEDDKCIRKENFKEGSYWMAFQVTDKVFMGEESIDDTSKPLEPIDFNFGCIYSEAFLFRRQLADGIMGMNFQSGTFVHALKKSRAIEHEMFSICFHTDGGTLVLGGAESLLWEKPNSMAYAHLTHAHGDTFFCVHVIGISIGSHKLSDSIIKISFSGSDSIVDSGTTDTYLPTHLLSEFKNIWKTEVKWEYESDTSFKLTEDQVAALPSIIITIVGENAHIEVEMPPDAYMVKTSDGSYQMAIFFDEKSGGGVLGANFMKNHDILFDKENSRIGFAKANCKYRELQEKQKHIALGCVLKHEMVTAGTCNATCSGADLNSTIFAVGYKNWTDQYINRADPNCPPIEPESHVCIIQCLDEASMDGCDYPIWLPCDIDCNQLMVSEKEGFGCTKTLERNCITGNSCPEARNGVIVKYLVYFNSTNEPCENWNKRLDIRWLLEDKISSSLSIGGGNIEIHYIAHDGDIHNCKLPFEVHVYKNDLKDDVLHAHAVQYLENVVVDKLTFDIGEILDTNMNVSSLGVYSASSGIQLVRIETHTKYWWVFGLICMVVFVILVMCKLDCKNCGAGDGTYFRMSSGGNGSDGEDWDHSSPRSSISSGHDGSTISSGVGIQLQGNSKTQETDWSTSNAEYEYDNVI